MKNIKQSYNWMEKCGEAHREGVYGEMEAMLLYSLDAAE